MNKLMLSLALTLALSACQQQGAQPAAAPAPAAKPAPLDQPAQPPAPKTADQLAAEKYDSVLAGDWRDAKNKARDGYRHPKEMLQFFGLKPDMTVIEITPAGGWFTEVLAPFLRDGGKYIGAVYDEKAALHRSPPKAAIRNSKRNSNRAQMRTARRRSRVLPARRRCSVRTIRPTWC